MGFAGMILVYIIPLRTRLESNLHNRLKKRQSSVGIIDAGAIRNLQCDGR